MAQVSTSRTERWSLVVSRILFTAAALVGIKVLVDLSDTIDHQNKERICFFELSTETDKIDSDIAATQARIFEAAILRPSPGDEISDELQRLGNELHMLLEDRTEAYQKRNNAAERC